ncbi:hypothetical protein LTR86_010919 [Recurvomyces mirabilis]|nr:hypothetical protein LTR86_010919 [Recurvomyces mirabilis]
MSCHPRTETESEIAGNFDNDHSTVLPIPPAYQATQHQGQPAPFQLSCCLEQERTAGCVDTEDDKMVNDLESIRSDDYTTVADGSELTACGHDDTGPKTGDVAKASEEQILSVVFDDKFKSLMRTVRKSDPAYDADHSYSVLRIYPMGSSSNDTIAVLVEGRTTDLNTANEFVLTTAGQRESVIPVNATERLVCPAVISSTEEPNAYWSLPLQFGTTELRQSPYGEFWITAAAKPVGSGAEGSRDLWGILAVIHDADVPNMAVFLAAMSVAKLNDT